MLGPTASGKSAVALDLAERLGAELFSVDSMQVYREMDIGTAKPSAAEQARVTHRLIDIVEPSVEFTLAEFQRLGTELLDADTHRPVVIAGGTGLYFRSLVDPMTLAPADDDVRRKLESTPHHALVEELRGADPAVADYVDMANPHRVIRAVEVLRLTSETPSQRAGSAEREAWSTFQPLRPFLAVGLDPGAGIGDRIERRFDAMLDDGLLAEVAGLQHRLGRTAAQAVGYKELLPVVRGGASLEEGREAAIAATRALAKRQRTYFRKDPRIRWIEWHDDVGERTARVSRALELAT